MSVTLRGLGAQVGVHRRHNSPALNALTVLGTVASRGPGVTAQELSSVLSMSLATTYDTVNLLLQQNYLVRLPDLSGFALGPKAAGLHGGPTAPIASVAMPLPAGVSAILTELRRTERGGIHLLGYQRAGESEPVVVVLDADPDVSILMADRQISDPYYSAAGRLVLAEQQRDPETRSRGFAVYIDAAQPSAASLAVPVRGSTATLLAGLTLSTTTIRLEQPDQQVHRLRLIARRLGEELDATR